jgi:hypothetical protein
VVVTLRGVAIEGNLGCFVKRKSSPALRSPNRRLGCQGNLKERVFLIENLVFGCSTYSQSAARDERVV